MVLSFSNAVKIAPDVLFRLVSDEVVLVNLSTQRYLGLNPVGARMWMALQEASSVQAAYEQLLEEYDVEPSELRGDFEEFLGQLLAQELIVVTTPTP